MGKRKPRRRKMSTSMRDVRRAVRRYKREIVWDSLHKANTWTQIEQCRDNLECLIEKAERSRSVIEVLATLDDGAPPPTKKEIIGQLADVAVDIERLRVITKTVWSKSRFALDQILLKLEATDVVV